MNVWVIKDGETLPVEPAARVMRTGLLAAELHRRGHTVTWWTSTFSHHRKLFLYHRDTTVDVAPGYCLQLLHGGDYSRNISLQRFRQHRRVGRSFAAAAPTAARPDVIVAAFPTIDLAHAAVTFGRREGIPVVVDVRDTWPDDIVGVCPPALRPAARFLLRGEEARARFACRHATALVAVSQAYLEWALEHAGRPAGPLDAVHYIGHQQITDAVSHAPPGRTPVLRDVAPGTIVFTYVGGLGPSYELTLIAEAARRLRDNRRVHFVVAGDGEQSAALLRAGSSLPNLTLTGWLAVDQVRDLLASSHVGLAPCRAAKERMPNKVFEYMAAGLPVLSSLEGEMADVLAKHAAGLSYRAGDADALTAHVERLAQDDGARREMARRSRALFERRFNAAAIYDAYATQIEQFGAPNPHRAHASA